MRTHDQLAVRIALGIVVALAAFIAPNAVASALPASPSAASTAAATAAPIGPVADDPTTLGAFYRTPASLPATNGDLVRSEPTTFVLDPIVKIKPPSNTFRMMYRSTNRTGQPIAVTGTVLVPRTRWAGRGQRPIIGYAAGTQGLADKCAPSYALTTGTEYESVFIAGLLARGYAVAMTDYEGLGTDGVHTYMTRESQGHAVLDAVRAAQRLTAAGLPSDGPVALTGYSQGGGASASAAELAPTYAPELSIKGVAVGAVPGNLDDVARTIDGSLYFGFLGYAIVGVTAAYGTPLDSILNARGLQTMAKLKTECTVESIATWGFTKSKNLTLTGQPVADILKQPAFTGMLSDQVIGTIKPVSVPILVTHSLLDDVVPYKAGKSVAKAWCRKGAKVNFATIATPTHVGGAIASFPRVFTFLEARFGNLPNVALSNCWLL